MRRLRIAICVAHFHPVVGGSERQMQRLAERFRERGHEVFVLTRAMRGQAVHETLSGYPVHRVIRNLSVGPAFGASFIASLAAELIARRRSYDVIVAAQLPWEAIATGFVAKILGKPTLVFAASTGAKGDVAQILHARGSRLLRRLALSNSAFVALSSQAERELLQLGCPTDSMLRSTNGVDLQTFQPAAGEPERDRTVLYLSRLSPAKNPQVLLRAWQTVNRGGQYKLLVAGDGPLADELRSLSDQLALKNVEYLGNVSDVPAVHRRASVYVLPSPSEGCSNALLEAMASGLCPVATRVPGNIDVVEEGVNGLLFEHDDAPQLAAALERVLADEPLRRRLSEAARRHMTEHHDLDHIASDLLDRLAGISTTRRRK